VYFAFVVGFSSVLRADETQRVVTEQQLHALCAQPGG
jgi:hypothetical protein